METSLSTKQDSTGFIISIYEIPTLPIAVCFILGIIAGRNWPEPLIGILGFLLCWVFARIRLWIRKCFLLGAIFFTGWIVYLCKNLPLHPYDLRLIGISGPTIATLVGQVNELKGLGPGGALVKQTAQMFLDLESIEIEGVKRPGYGRVLVRMDYEPPLECRKGALVRVDGVLKPVPLPPLKGLFNWRAYLEGFGIEFMLESDRASDLKVLKAAEASLLEQWREYAARQLTRGLSSSEDSIARIKLLQAMLLGYRDVVDEEIMEPFKKTGTIHLFAISGLHIGCVAGVIYPLFRVLQLSKSIAWILTVMCIWLYTAATGWQISAIRASTMISIFAAAQLLRRPSNLINLVGAATLILLIINPNQLFQPAFQLSFSVISALTIGLRLMQRSQWRQEAELQLPPHLLSLRQRLSRQILKLLSQSFKISLIAWVGSIIWTGGYFHLFTPGALLANILAMPLAFVIVAAGIGSIIIGPLWEYLSEFFNAAAFGTIGAVQLINKIISSLPCSWGYISTFPVLVFPLIVWWSICFVGKIHPFKGKSFWVTVIVSILGGINVVYELWRTYQFIEITIIPCRGGGAIWVKESQARAYFLFDAGTITTARYLVEPYLRAKGINKLPVLVVSHGDAMHCSGCSHIWNELDPRWVVISTARQRSQVYRNFVELVRANAKERLIEVKEKDRIYDWQVLHPPSELNVTRADDVAVVLYRKFGNVSLLLLGDLSLEEQLRLLQRYPALKADIIIGGEPKNGFYSLAPELIYHLKPSVIVALDAEYPAPLRLSREAMRLIGQSGAVALRTNGTNPYLIQVYRNGYVIKDGQTGRLLMRVRLSNRGSSIF